MSELLTYSVHNHSINQSGCSSCLPFFPRQCSCGGMIHAETNDHIFHGFVVSYKCDKCDFTLDAIEE